MVYENIDSTIIYTKVLNPRYLLMLRFLQMFSYWRNVKENQIKSHKKYHEIHNILFYKYKNKIWFLYISKSISIKVLF